MSVCQSARIRVIRAIRVLSSVNSLSDYTQSKLRLFAICSPHPSGLRACRTHRVCARGAEQKKIYTVSNNSSHSSRVILASFIIFLIIPFPISSPGCTVINVVLPSGWRMNKWLPFCLICEKPIFSSALINFFAGRGLILSI